MLAIKRVSAMLNDINFNLYISYLFNCYIYIIYALSYLVCSKSHKGGGGGGVGGSADEVHMRILFEFTNKGRTRGHA